MFSTVGTTNAIALTTANVWSERFARVSRPSYRDWIYGIRGNST